MQTENLQCNPARCPAQLSGTKTCQLPATPLRHGEGGCQIDFPLAGVLESASIKDG